MTVSLSTANNHLSSMSALAPVPAYLSNDACQIHLVADRITSLSAGSTHKVYRAWRFEVVCRTDADRIGSTRFTAPIAPGPWAPSGSRYAMELEPGQGAIAPGESARFTWTVTTDGVTNPLVIAHDRARQWLLNAGWQPDALGSELYEESRPTAQTGLDGWEDEGGSPVAFSGQPHSVVS
jgi:hypothetical protein